MSVIDEHREAFANAYNVSGDELFYKHLGFWLMNPEKLKGYALSSEFGGTNQYWGRQPFKSIRVSGSLMTVMEAYRGRLDTTPSLEDFFSEWLYSFETNEEENRFSDKREGESAQSYVFRWCEKWARIHPFYPGDMSIAVSEWFIHIIIQSYQGFLSERIVELWLNDNLSALKEYASLDEYSEMEVVHSPEAMDYKYNSDFVVLENGKPLFSVQVKPRTYFHKTDPIIGEGLYIDKIQNLKKDSALERDYGIRQYYIDRDTIMREDYPPELIASQSIMVDETTHQTWKSIRQQADGSFIRVSEYRKTPPQYIRFPF